MAEDTSGIDSGAGEPRGADPWDVVLDDDFVNSAAIKESELEPIARLPRGWTPQSGGGRDGSDRPAVDYEDEAPSAHPRRLTVWLSFLVFMICAGLVVSQSFFARRINGNAPDAGASGTNAKLYPGQAGAPSSAATGTGAAGTGVGASASASRASVSATATVTPRATGRAPIAAATAFPGTVSTSGGQQYIRLSVDAQTDCTTNDRVSSSFADLIGQTHGCLALDYALYKDGSNDQFTVAAFTLRQAADSEGLVAQLADDANDVQIALVQPPAGSGLPTLATDTGAVQTFAGTGRVVIIGVAQWSDGRSSDPQDLEKLLTPLMGQVTSTVSTYEGDG